MCAPMLDIRIREGTAKLLFDDQTYYDLESTLVRQPTAPVSEPVTILLL